MKSISTAKPNGAATLRSLPLLLLLMGMLLTQGPAQAGKVATKAARPPAASAQAPTPAGPAAPTGVSAAPGNGLVTLTWNGSAGAAYYNVYGSTDPKALPAAYTQIGTVPDAGAATDAFTQTGLVNGATYYYYVVAENNGGLSPPSAIASTPVSLPAPTGLTATPGNSSVTLNWTASGAPGAASYNVYEAATPNGTFTQIGTAYGTTFTQTGLTNGASYSYYLVPVNNGGVGTQSATISSTVSLPAPTGLSATAGNGTVTVTWTASAAPGASYYSVFQSTSASGPYANVGTVTETGAADSFTQTGLTNGAAYYYYVVAENNGSASPNSQTVSAVVSLPAPTGLTATPGSGSVTLNWTASAAPGASYYEVFGATALNGAYADLGPVYGTTFVQTGLASGTTYYYYVIPANNGGAGIPSAIVSSAISQATPVLTATPGNGSVSLSWDAVSGASYYNLYESTDGVNFTYFDYAYGTNYTRSGRTNGQTYYYYFVPVINGNGGTQSATVSALISLPPPTNLTATPGNGSITLNWTASGTPGASYYYLYESTDGVNFTYFDYAYGTNYTRAGRTNGQAYYYYLIPYNAGGAGIQSATVSTSDSLPPPTNLTATPGNGLITLNWTASAAPGAGYYNLYESTDGVNFTYFDYAYGTNYTRSGRTNGVTYYYYLVPVNAGGAGTQSATVSTSVGLPPPTNLTAAPGNGSITLNWTASGAPGATYYKLYESTDGVNFTYFDYSYGTNYTRGGRTNGQTYSYYVVPVNNGDVGIPSATVSASVGLPPPTSLTATLGAGAVTLNWTASAFPGATYYNLYESTDGVNFTYFDYAYGTNYTRTGRTNGQAYYYYVVPVNNGGSGIQSATVSALVGLPPPTNLTATPGNGSITLNWTASGAPGADYYNLYESTDGVNFTYFDYAYGTNYTRGGRTNGVTYSYYVVPVNNGSVGTQSATVSALVGLADPTGLTATPGNNSVTLNWTAPSTPGATGYNVYQATSLNGPFTKVGSPAATTFTQSGLLAGTTYYYYVTATNATDESSPSATAQATTLGPDVTPPTTTISAGPAGGSNSCSASVTFTVSGSDNVTPAASLLYEYSLDGAAFTAPAGAATITLGPLTDGPHTFVVKAVDQAGNVDPAGVTVHFTTDTVAPVVSAVSATGLTATGATIGWTTDKAATSLVDYRVAGTTTWTSTTLAPTLVTAHSVSLTGLNVSANYEYRVHSADGCGNETISPVGTFSTTSDTATPSTSITAGPAEGSLSCTGTGIALTYTGTDTITPAANLQYETSLDGAAFSAPSSATTITLPALTDGAHAFTVKAVDQYGNVDPTGATRHFTVSLAPPAVSAVGLNVLDVRTTVTWTTDKPSSSQVEYGTTTAYGSTTTLDTGLTTSHSVSVKGLTPQTLYHFRVHSADACHDGVSPDATFTTSAPLLANLQVTALQFQNSVQPGQTLSVGWTVQNMGPGDTRASWTDGLYLSSAPTLNAQSVPLGKFSANDALMAGDTYSLSQTVTLPTVPPGNYYLVLQADDAQAIPQAGTAGDVLAMPIEFVKVQTLIATPAQTALTLLVNVPQTVTLDLSDLSSTPMSGLTAVVSGASANVKVQVTPPASLDAMSSGKVQVSVVATDDSVLSDTATVTLTDGAGDTAEATLNLSVTPNKPNLVAAPGTLSQGMVRGQLVNGQETPSQTLVSVTLTNTGAAVATNLKVAIPSLPWLALASPVALGDLAPGASTQVVLRLSPPSTLPLGNYTGLLAVNGDNTAIPISYAFNCISSAKGDLKVSTTDEFSYFAADHPPLTGAAVTLTDATTGATVLSGTTDGEGVLLQQNVTEGSYNIEVTSPGHADYRSSVRVTAGQETDVNAFLSRQLVTYQWSVVPVDLQDHYEVVLQAVFETHVPAPVVTISPTQLDLSKLSYDASGKATVYFTVTNHGLIAADDTQLAFPDRPDYSLVPSMGDLGKLSALTTIVVPVTVTRLTGGAAAAHAAGMTARASANASGGGSCTYQATLTYYYFCSTTVSQTVTVNVTTPGCNQTGTPPPTGSRNPSQGDGNSSGGASGPGGYGAYSGGIPPEVDILPDFCDPCTQKRTAAILLCLINFIPGTGCACSAYGNGAQCIAAGIGGGASSGTVISCAIAVIDTAANCAKNFASFSPIGIGLKVAECVYGIGTACDDDPPPGPPGPGPGGSGGGPGGPGGKGGKGGLGAHSVLAHRLLAHASTTAGSTYQPTPEDTQLTQEAYRLTDMISPTAYLFGQPKWLEGNLQDGPVFQAFLSAFRAAIDPGKGTNSRISDADRASLLALPLPSQIVPADVGTLVDRWNRTVDYNAAGITSVSQVPAGQSTDFIATDDFATAANAAKAAADADIADGNLNLLDGVNNAVQVLKSELFSPQSAGTCARVKIELDQTVAITRTAFKATLVLSNAAQSAPLSNVKIALKVTDLAGNDRTGLFVIGTPSASGFNAVDGTGTLAVGTSGTAIWTILPTQAAAATGTTQYYVSGEIDYTQNGTALVIPLYPTGITVKPDPYLQLHYFLQRDVYSDDPFTPQIEPAEPFSLGLLVVNAGKGTAHDMTITSSQPKIVENDKGLLIGFKLIGTQVNTQPVSPSLTVDLGDIAPSGTAVADFLLTSTLAGKFISYDAAFKHVDDLGDAQTSLIDSVDIHDLTHVVRIDDPVDDGKPDFLYTQTPNASDLPDQVFSSDGTSLPVTSLTDAGVDGAVSDSNLTVHLTEPTSSTGWVFLRLNDPALGNYQLMSVVRSDGKVIRLGDNAWTTNRLIHLQGQAPYQETRLYLFDNNSTGSYTLHYTQNAPVLAPVGGLKALADGTNVQFGGTGAGTGGGAGSGTVGAGSAIPVVVTASFPDALYAENVDRSAGIKIVPESGVAIPAVGDVITGSGVIRTDPNGERYLDTLSLTTVGAGQVAPLGLTTKPLFSGDFFYNAATGAGQKGMAGGLGLNVIGEYVRTVGQVLGSGDGSFQISDGFSRPVTVLLPNGANLPAVGSEVGVTGIVSVLPTQAGLTPLLRPRGGSDLAYDLSGLEGTFTSPGALLNAGNNLFSLPGIPLMPAPPAVLAGIGPPDGSGLLGVLSRYDAAAQSEVFWDAAGTEGPFGDLLEGEGYRLSLPPGQPQAITFSGVQTGFADSWVSLPKLGATRIGDPFNAPIDWASVQVNDGTRVSSLRDAAKNVTPGRINSVAQSFDSAAQKTRTLGLPEDTPDSTQLQPWLGYWVYSLQDQLALIVPAPAGQTAAPVLSSISPSTLPAGSPAFTLIVTGSGFAPQAAVAWNGQPQTTTFVSATQLTAAIPAADVAQKGTASITVVNPAGSGGASAPLPLTITPAGGTGKPPTVSLIVKGAVFAPATLVLQASPKAALHGAAIAKVEFYSGTTLLGAAMTTPYHLTLPGLTPGIYSLTAKVTDSAGLSATSAVVTVTITAPPAPVPVIAKLAPVSATGGDGDTPLTITGKGFLPAAHVSFGGQPLAPVTASSDGKSLTTTIPAGLLLTPGKVSVVVTNDPTSGGGGGPSKPATFTIKVPPVSVTSLSQNTAAVQAAGSADLVLTLAGKGFQSGSVVHWKVGTADTSLLTTFGSAVSLTANVPASLLGAVGKASVTVVNPAPNQAVSNPTSFAVGVPTILLTTVTFSRDAGQNVQAQVTLSNNGAYAVTNLLLTGLTLVTPGQTFPASGLSVALGSGPANSLGGHGTGTALVTFPGTSALPSGTVVKTLTAAGSYTGGGYSSVKTLTTSKPPTKLP